MTYEIKKYLVIICLLVVVIYVEIKIIDATSYRGFEELVFDYTSHSRADGFCVGYLERVSNTSNNEKIQELCQEIAFGTAYAEKEILAKTEPQMHNTYLGFQALKQIFYGK